MAHVDIYKFELQEGTDNTLVAVWKFVGSRPKSKRPGGSGSSSSSGIKVGSYVKIKSGAKWYNGVAIDSWVFGETWKVYEVRGDRVVLNANKSGSHHIMSPINEKYLVSASSRSRSREADYGISTYSESGGIITDYPEKEEQVDHYNVRWYYATGNGEWFTGQMQDENRHLSTYSFPSNATAVKVSVKPYSKKHKVNGKERTYWTGVRKAKEKKISELPPAKLPAPAVTIDRYDLTAKEENIKDAKAESVEFKVYKGNKTFTTGIVDVKLASAKFNCKVDGGAEYKVKARAINYIGRSKVYGEWSDLSGIAMGAPGVPTDVKVFAESKTSVKLTYKGNKAAKSYKIEYATKKEYFDASSEVKSATSQSEVCYITGMETGQGWYFRVCAVGDQGESGWSNVVYLKIGCKPAPPTVWSLGGTAMIGEDVRLFWVHNSEDKSKQREAQIMITVNGESNLVTVETPPTETDESKENTDIIYHYDVDMTNYQNGGEVLWKVRTKGIIEEWSDWSEQRRIGVYAPPTASLEVQYDESNTIHDFPINITASCGPEPQKAVSYNLQFIVDHTHTVEDEMGNEEIVLEGTTVYNKTFNTNENEIDITVTPDDVIFTDGEPYTMKLTVSMDSGLTATAEEQFIISWGTAFYLPDASLTYDKDTTAMYIQPFCIDQTTIDLEEPQLLNNVELAVYRREQNGEFVLIGEKIQNDGVSSVTDPHPNINSVFYRIVARDISTSRMGYTDLPGYKIDEPGIIIQWDEKWVEFDYAEEVAPEKKPWSGSLVRLPYNVTSSESTNIDNTSVKYIGRKYPVAYYGTNVSTTNDFRCDIDKKDVETINALRRLSLYPGTCYVRETNGQGYNAIVNVNMSFDCRNVVVPVSIKVTKVDGDK